MGAELAEGGVVHLAVERDVVLDLGAAVDAVQDVTLQVLVHGIVLLQHVKRDAVERQLLGDVLHKHTHTHTNQITHTHVQSHTHAGASTQTQTK